MEGQKQTRVFDSRCQNSSSVIQNIFQATITLKIIRPKKDDTYTLANKVYRHIIFPCYKVDMCHKRLQIHLKLLKVFPTSFAKLLFETFFCCCCPLGTNKFPIYIFHSNIKLLPVEMLGRR